ncbi:MAG: GTP-dependent dephospho-CoA kinase family protein [Methanosarcinales archaeon]|nr:GTP-dependent dephospho-CoA kinase family protein [Methanosarcinales archaeon]
MQTMDDAYLSLPPELRAGLRFPIGKVYSGNGPAVIQKINDELNAALMVVAIGDVTTFNALAANVIPEISIIDGMTKRKAVADDVINGIKHASYSFMHVDNPAGTITEDLITTIDIAFRSDTPVQIVVDGEEDLAVIPVIALSPVGTAVMYGQPNEGCVLVHVTEEKKIIIRNIIKQMTFTGNEQISEIWRKLYGH